MNLDLVTVNYWLWVIVLVLYVPMLPLVFFLVWLEYRHPHLYAKLPRWLK